MMYLLHDGFPFVTEGTFNKPSLIARVLDDGTNQTQKYQYNPIGKPTVAIDNNLKQVAYIFG
jgi:hypothetical protein